MDGMIYPKFRIVVTPRKGERDIGKGGVYRNLQFPVMFIFHIKKILDMFPSNIKI